MYRGIPIIQTILDEENGDTECHRIKRVRRALVIDTIGNNLPSQREVICGIYTSSKSPYTKPNRIK